MSDVIVSPSILSADFANLESEIKNVVSYGAKWVHIDVMDGHFVPNITIGAPVVKSIRKVTDAILDVHLMIENPDKYIPDFINAGSDVITFHIESVDEKKAYKCIEMIKQANKLAGISIKPKTPASKIFQYLKDVDMVLVMTVEPGFSGQAFMSDCAEKIADVKKYCDKIKFIQVDGGINDKTAPICKQFGANCFVCGNYIFKAQNQKLAINTILGI